MWHKYLQIITYKPVRQQYNFYWHLAQNNDSVMLTTALNDFHINTKKNRQNSQGCKLLAIQHPLLKIHSPKIKQWTDQVFWRKAAQQNIPHVAIA